ncbi:MAG: M23 family metallopeptidase [Paracoccaceae bacterium]
MMKHLLPLLLIGLLTTSLALAQTISHPENAPEILSDFLSSTGVKGKTRDALHQGIDVGGPVGTRVIAAADGIVVETDIGTCWGPTIVIDHGLGPDGRPLIAAYGHLGGTNLSKGMKVKRGQIIGQLGDNQNVFRCIGGVRHLHFQLGRKHRSGGKGTTWGHVRYLVDGRTGVNPHLYWADGPNRVTCFDPTRRFPRGTLTFPIPCK